MAIKANNSQEAVVVNRPYYYGIGDFKILGINLDFDELKELGFDRSKEPVYEVQTLNGIKRKITFYCEHEETGLKKPLDFFISNEDAVNKSGTVKIINNFGQNTSAASVDAIKADPRYTWFRHDGIRIAKEGEIELIEFIVNWLNVKNYTSKKESMEGVLPDEVTIDNWEKLVDGNVKELEKYRKDKPNNKVGILVHINGKYMNLYNRRFSRFNNTRLDQWKLYADKQASSGYPIPGDYFIGDLKEYVGGNITPDDIEDIPEVDTKKSFLDDLNDL